MLQYCWTVLPQGLKNSLTIIVEVLSKKLRHIQLKSGVILKYIDDILMTSSTYRGYLLNTITVLNYLAQSGYEVLPHKAQICKQKVAYLGFELKQGTGCLMEIENKALLH